MDTLLYRVSDLSVLPDNFKIALKRWNQLEVEKSMSMVPKLLENLEVNSSGVQHQNPHISTVIGLCVGNVVTSHVDVTSYGVFLFSNSILIISKQ